jgi:hypothetical protein
MVMEKGGWSYGQAEIDAVTYPLWVPGRYYSSPHERSLTTSNNELQTLVIPIYVPGPNGCAIDELGLEIDRTGTASGTFRLGIYDDYEGSPWDLILDAGTCDTGHSGWQHVDVSLRLRGWAWLAAVFDDYVVPPYWRAFGLSPVGILGFPRAGSTDIPAGYAVEISSAVIQAGLPVRFPMNAALGVQPSRETPLPRLMVRAA